MILTFFTETFDVKNHRVINTHRSIAAEYLKGWFWLDFLSIIPFEFIFKNLENRATAENLTEFNQSIRIVRITKIYKLVRFLRLAKMAKAFKLKRNFKMKSNLKITSGLMRMGYFLGGLVLMVHIMASIWCAFPQFDKHSWMEGKIQGLADSGEKISMEDKKRVYIVALYYIVQTVTTVGYGDVNPATTKERIFQICVMLIGVIAFSFIAGTLSSLISSFDDVMAEKNKNSERLAALNNAYEFGEQLQLKLEKNLEFSVE
jgi:potassium voltage-gated channel Eag-related subfamily H protein 7